MDYMDLNILCPKEAVKINHSFIHLVIIDIRRQFSTLSILLCCITLSSGRKLLNACLIPMQEMHGTSVSALEACLPRIIPSSWQ